MRKAILLASFIVWAMAGTARADGTKIDCSDTDLAFKDSAFTVDCTDISRSSINLEEGVGGSKRKELFAMSHSGGVTFLLALDTSVLGTRVYMKRAELEEQISKTFTQLSIHDWESANNASGFETATFTGDFDNGAQLQCRAFRREMNRRYDGVGRRVLGITCTTQGDEAALAALAKLDAPGD
ncbi:MAG TPA: hypothetical protein VHE77_19180 [Dongiaceae bacterium]|jgi:hypothetical protein|nr:hypothetical protein [Dongiaceae bacterium]